MQISEDLQKVLDAAMELDEVVSVEAKEPPANLLTQVGSGEYVYLDYVVKIINEEQLPLAFLVPTSMIGPDSYKQLPIKDLLNCGCTHLDDGIGHICGYSPFANTGKTTYLVRYPDGLLVKLVDTNPDLVIIPTDNLKELVGKLYTLDKVKTIKVEKIIDPKLIEENGEDAVMIRAAIDINYDKVVDHWVGFVATKLVYDTDSGHEWAIDNLQNLINLNNA